MPYSRVRAELQFRGEPFPQPRDYHYECMLALARNRVEVSAGVLTELLSSLAIADVAYTAAKTGHLLRYPERQLHKLPMGQPSEYEAKGSIEVIASDSLHEFAEWAPFRDKANKET